MWSSETVNFRFTPELVKRMSRPLDLDGNHATATVTSGTDPVRQDGGLAAADRSP